MLGIIDSLFGAWEIGEMSGEIFFGIKLIALVMLYGYMHINLGGGILSTAVFAIFGYYILFYMQGMLALVILVLFYLMMHAFDIIWGGDIARNKIMERRAVKEQMAEARQQMMPHPMMRQMVHPASPFMRRGPPIGFP